MLNPATLIASAVPLSCADDVSVRMCDHCGVNATCCALLPFRKSCLPLSVPSPLMSRSQPRNVTRISALPASESPRTGAGGVIRSAIGARPRAARSTSVRRASANESARCRRNERAIAACVGAISVVSPGRYGRRRCSESIATTSCSSPLTPFRNPKVPEPEPTAPPIRSIIVSSVSRPACAFADSVTVSTRTRSTCDARRSSTTVPSTSSADVPRAFTCATPTSFVAMAVGTNRRRSSESAVINTSANDGP